MSDIGPTLPALLLLVGGLILRNSSAVLCALCLVHDEAPLHEPHIMQLAGVPCSHVAICRLPSTASELLQSGSSVATAHPLPTACQLLQLGSGAASSHLLHTASQLIQQRLHHCQQTCGGYDICPHAHYKQWLWPLLSSTQLVHTVHINF